MRARDRLPTTLTMTVHIIGHHGEGLDVTTHLIREMYRTARRHTRTEPHTMPESRGFSQYSKELIWSELGHMVTRLGMSHWMCLYSVCAVVTPGSPGLGVRVTTLDPATGDRRVSPAQHRRSRHTAATELAQRHFTVLTCLLTYIDDKSHWF